MNKKILIGCLIAGILITISACYSKIDNSDISADTKPGVIDVNNTNTTDSTISSELQQAMDEGWIEENWTGATEPDETKPNETKPEETKPNETKPEETKPGETKPEAGISTYEQYLSLSAAEQQAFYETFDSVDAYFAWLNNAKAEYEAKQNATELEGGIVDIGGRSN